MRTRSHSARRASAHKKRCAEYRAQSRRAGCKGLRRPRCRKTKNCKMADGKKRHFCRTRRNKKY